MLDIWTWERERERKFKLGSCFSQSYRRKQREKQRGEHLWCQLRLLCVSGLPPRGRLKGTNAPPDDADQQRHDCKGGFLDRFQGNGCLKGVHCFMCNNNAQQQSSASSPTQNLSQRDTPVAALFGWLNWRQHTDCVAYLCWKYTTVDFFNFANMLTLKFRMWWYHQGRSSICDITLKDTVGGNIFVCTKKHEASIPLL